MREIKFRGDRVDGHGWVYGSLVITDNIPVPTGNGLVKNMTCYFIYERDGKINHVYERSVGQFTGLESVEGQEIYEKDIIVWIDSDGIERRNIVEFVNGGFVLCNNRYNLGHYCTNENQPKVVGNSYENRNLARY